MRKTVVFAEDSKEALEIIARELGPTALILETRRVKDGVEVVAGITDVPSASAQRENFNRVLNEVRTNQTFLNKGPELAPTKPAASAAGQAPSAGAPDRLNHILPRLDDITARLRAPDKPRRDDVPDARLRELSAWGLNTQLLGEPGALQGDALSLLHQRLCAPDFDRRLAEADVIFVHGASGCGKSSTIARIAAQLKAAQPTRKLVLAATDRRKLGALEYMRQIGRLLDIPVLSLTPDYQGFDNMVARGFTVCLDMPSDLQTSLAAARTLVRTIGDKHRLMPLVALEAAMSDQACKVILAGAAEFCREVILTKMDEVKPTGNLLTGILGQGARISACADGAQSLARLGEFSASMLKDWFEQPQWAACAA